MMNESATCSPLQTDDAALRRLAVLDLNLLVVLAALMQDCSVTLAAQRLFVGQSAISASLKRLRAVFDDPLLVKAGRGMVPTERAIALRPALESALSTIDALAFTPPSFKPDQARMTLRIGLSDDNEIVFLPAIARELIRQAPQVRLIAHPISHTDIRASLDRGDVDVGISVFGDLSAWHRSEVLFEQGYGCLFDPRTRRRSTPLTLEEYLASQQLIVTFDGTLQGKVDRVLAARRLERDVHLGTARFGTLPHLVRGTRLVASLPELVGRVLAREHDLAFCTLPFEVPPGLPRMAWHCRNELDLASQWFRHLIADCVKKVVLSTRGLTTSSGQARRAKPRATRRR